MKIWQVVLLLYAAVWTLYGVTHWWKRRGLRAVPGPWRVTGKNDLMSPPTFTWFADNNTQMQTRGPYGTQDEARRAVNRLNREYRSTYRFLYGATPDSRRDDVRGRAR